MKKRIKRKIKIDLNASKKDVFVGRGSFKTYENKPLCFGHPLQD